MTSHVNWYPHTCFNFAVFADYVEDHAIKQELPVLKLGRPVQILGILSWNKLNSSGAVAHM